MNAHNHNHNDSIIDLVQKHLGRDLGAKAKGELKHHIEECPDCKVYVDSVEETVKLYKSIDSATDIPSGVSERLFKVLHLKKDS
ncbi:MAG: hypothetical protein ISR83_00950 [Candidatus Marinimicrobia bacterium]|nr:hypothetical protein [Candidatus Neomarinimicrobiota bacterium]